MLNTNNKMLNIIYLSRKKNPRNVNVIRNLFIEFERLSDEETENLLYYLRNARDEGNWGVEMKGASSQ
jgi:hypothetical protein